MAPREIAPVTGWDNLPHRADTSTGADIARIKWYRNKLAHDGDGKLSLADFSQYWRDLECVSINFNHNLGKRVNRSHPIYLFALFICLSISQSVSLFL